MRMSDWSSDVCSSDLDAERAEELERDREAETEALDREVDREVHDDERQREHDRRPELRPAHPVHRRTGDREQKDRKSVGKGKSVSVRVDLGGRPIIQKNKKKTK